MSGVTDAVVAGLTTTATSIMSGIGEIIPVAMPILGSVMVVIVGVKVFKRIAGK